MRPSQANAEQRHRAGGFAAAARVGLHEKHTENGLEPRTEMT